MVQRDADDGGQSQFVHPFGQSLLYVIVNVASSYCMVN